VATSIELAGAVAVALGIADETIKLHLKTIRAAGAISFKGYGRSAAAMTPLDASRLIIAVAGSTFAKDSAAVLERFSKLEPLTKKGRGLKLEDFLASRIGAGRTWRNVPL
jgi:predicted ArsR family transcriptional regulator